LKKKKHHTSQGSERPPLAASDAVPAASLSLQLRHRLPLAACRLLLAHGCSRCRIPNPPSGPSTWPSAPAGHTILPRHAAPAGRTSLPLHAALVGLAPRSGSGATAHRERCSLATRAAAVSRARPRVLRSGSPAAARGRQEKEREENKIEMRGWERSRGQRYRWRHTCGSKEKSHHFGPVLGSTRDKFTAIGPGWSYQPR